MAALTNLIALVILGWLIYREFKSSRDEGHYPEDNS